MFWRQKIPQSLSPTIAGRLVRYFLCVPELLRTLLLRAAGIEHVLPPQTLWPILADTFRFKIVPSLHLSPLASAGPFASITYRTRIFRLYRTLRSAAASLWPFSVVCLTCAIAGCAANETTTRLDLRTDDPMRPSEGTATCPIIAMVGARTVRCAVQSYSRSE